METGNCEVRGVGSGHLRMAIEKNTLANDQEHGLSAGKGTNSILIKKHTHGLPFPHFLQGHWETRVRERYPTCEYLRVS